MRYQLIIFSIIFYIVLFSEDPAVEPFVTIENREFDIAGPSKATLKITTSAEEVTIMVFAKNNQSLVLRRGEKGDYYQASSVDSNPRYAGVPVKFLPPHPKDVDLDRFEDSWKNTIEFEAVVPTDWTYIDPEGNVKDGIRIVVTEKDGSSRSAEIVMTTDFITITY